MSEGVLDYCLLGPILDSWNMQMDNLATMLLDDNVSGHSRTLLSLEKIRIYCLALQQNICYLVYPSLVEQVTM